MKLQSGSEKRDLLQQMYSAEITPFKLVSFGDTYELLVHFLCRVDQYEADLAHRLGGVTELSVKFNTPDRNEHAVVIQFDGDA